MLLKQIQIGWGTSLEKKSPAIVEFFKNFQLTADDVSCYGLRDFS